MENFRCFSEAEVYAAPGLNIISGDNGAGKTSVLEAMYIAGRGRSFRHVEYRPIIKSGAESCRVVCRLHDVDESASSQIIGFRYGARDKEFRLNREPVLKRSQLAEAFPLLFIGPDPQSFLTEGSEIRRRYLDLGLFHVEHDYAGLLQMYGKLLRQRNAALKSGLKGMEVPWEGSMVEVAETIDSKRAHFSALLSTAINSIIAEWLPDIPIDITYQRGWPAECDLITALHQKRQIDARQCFTSVGPHRADFRITSSRLKTGKRLSRGQMKLLVFAVQFALGEVLKGHAPRLHDLVLLVDDYSSELDPSNQKRVLEKAGAVFHQIFATTIHKGGLPPQLEAKLFHVEHGSLAAMGV